jgi:iron complex transport system substrate-binding protein
VDDVLATIVMVGGLLGLDKPARDVVQDMRDEIRQVREFSSVWPDRPRVYFEEWYEPLIAGIRWVSEIVEIAGGRDIFPELRDKPSARDRVVDPAEVIRRDPQIVLASWCGKPVDIASIEARPGWERMSAVSSGRIHEVDGADILSPGPSLLVGLRQIHEIIQEGLGA